VHLVWTKPNGDPVLQKAIKDHGLVTVHQHVHGGSQDFGVTGFEPEPHAQYLIFPRSLRKFVGRRIIGIRYDLVAEAVPAHPALPAKKRSSSSSPAAKKSKLVRFPAEADLVAKKPNVERRKKQAEAPQRHGPILPENTDPIKKEIQLALADLTAGRIDKVKRRLAALL
jgi:hypothetical protein